MKLFTLQLLSYLSVASAFVHAAPSKIHHSQQLAISSSSKDTPIELPTFANRDEYLQYMKGVSELPKGFAAGSADGTFVSPEAPAMGYLPIRATVLHLTQGPSDSWAAVFTQNKFPGSPVIVGRQRLASKSPLSAIVINNKVSNVCSGGDGVTDAEHVCGAVAEALGLPSPDHVLPSSTGVIGWRLPAKELAETIVPQAIANLQTDSALDAAAAICTTDRYPKVRSRTLSNGSRLVGIAKGAGMIEPNMATMLCYLMTDATMEKETLQTMLRAAVDESFNSISVDGDESTSDTTVLVSSNLVDGVDVDEFQSALQDVCRGLAADLVRNGEGTGHVMRVDISGFPGTPLEARRLGRHVVNSPLFKCAIAGNDPNTGRLAGAIGSFMGKFKPEESVADMTLKLGERVIFEKQKFVLEGQAVEEELSDYIQSAEYNDSSDFPPHQKFVDIAIDFGGTGSDAVVYGSDLTAEYVSINADYRS